ncbi:retinol dehydrogenase 12-like [Glandiceps talaboti]
MVKMSLEVDTTFENKVCIITGANTGIGFEATKKMTAKGCDVILACRSEERGRDAVRRIKNIDNNAKVEFMELDLSSLRSIRQFVNNFQSTGKPLHVLCNNAGVVSRTQCTTEDGFELCFGVNHLGHFLLTNMLLDDLKRTKEQHGEARIVVTSSFLHNPEKAFTKRAMPNLDFDNLMLDKEGTFLPALAYGNSKLACVLFTYELARRISQTGITCNCFHPGIILTTSILRYTSWLTRLITYTLSPLLQLLGLTQTLDYGGEMMYFLALDESLKGVTGKYFEDFKEMKSSEASYDKEIALRLWDISMELVRLKGEYTEPTS